MRTIPKTPIEGVKRVNINVPIGTHNSFKAATAARGENMTDVLLDFIKKYVEQYQASLAKKGRRA